MALTTTRSNPTSANEPNETNEAHVLYGRTAHEEAPDAGLVESEASEFRRSTAEEPEARSFETEFHLQHGRSRS